MSGLPGYDAWLEAPLEAHTRAEIAYEKAEELAAEWNALERCYSCGTDGERAICVDVENCHDDGEDHEICRECENEWEEWTPEMVLDAEGDR